MGVAFRVSKIEGGAFQQERARCNTKNRGSPKRAWASKQGRSEGGMARTKNEGSSRKYAEGGQMGTFAGGEDGEKYLAWGDGVGARERGERDDRREAVAGTQGGTSERQVRPPSGADSCFAASGKSRKGWAGHTQNDRPGRQQGKPCEVSQGVLLRGAVLFAFQRLNAARRRSGRPPEARGFERSRA